MFPFVLSICAAIINSDTEGLETNATALKNIALRETELDILGVVEHFAWLVAGCPKKKCRKASRHEASEWGDVFGQMQ